jgi:diadenosine tetraphosphate (Ap4A) HIT family hydrolase
MKPICALTASVRRHDLTTDARGSFLLDMIGLGDALLRVTDADRVNYEILGNNDPALHAHVTPRYAWEPEERRRWPDDTAVNLEAAARFGIRTIKFENSGQCERQLQALGCL